MKKFKFSDFLFESQCRVIQDFIGIFGRDVVYNDKRDFKLNQQKLEIIYQSLNKTFFNNSLPIDLKLKYCNTSKIQNILSKRNSEYDYSTISPLGCYSSIYTILNKNNEDIDDLDYYIITGKEKVIYDKQILLINSDLIDEHTFIFTVNCICHEMIHCYDEYCGDTTQQILLQKAYNCEIDSHTTNIFKQMVKEARKNKMKILSNINKNYVDFDKLNREAYKVLTEQRKYPSRLIKKNGKYYIDLSQYGHQGDMHPITNILGSVIHID